MRVVFRFYHDVWLIKSVTARCVQESARFRSRVALCFCLLMHGLVVVHYSLQAHPSIAQCSVSVAECVQAVLQSSLV